jgi:predicted DNA-binding transcriptional regulator YafY
LWDYLDLVRADRLVAIVLLLQTHGQMTVGDLAERLEVSERTIRRDLEGLSGAGVPVYPQRGRGGGWALLGGHRIDLSGLTAEEAQALFLVAGPNALVGVGVEPGVKSALRKLLAALPAPFREQVSAAGNAVLVDPVGWGRKSDQSPHLATLRNAVLAGVQVDMSYAKPGQEASPRRVHPYGLVSKGGTWYLLAGAEAGLRTFRLSRVRAVTPTEELVERPEDFDLAEAWESVQSEFPARTYAQGHGAVGGRPGGGAIHFRGPGAMGQLAAGGRKGHRRGVAALCRHFSQPWCCGRGTGAFRPPGRGRGAPPRSGRRWPRWARSW